MNMYLHGDGKSNIKPANGLALSASDVFAPRVPARAHGAIDIALTNPPLGDVNFYEIAAELARTGLLGKIKSVPGSNGYDVEVSARANAWTNERLRVVPHVCVEEAKAEVYTERAAAWQAKVIEALSASDQKKARHAQRYLDAANANLTKVKSLIASGKLTYVPAGSNAKGGALFLSAILEARLRNGKGGALG